MNIFSAVEKATINLVKKPWGREFWLVNTELYCIKIIECQSGVWSSDGRYHFHMDKDETFLVITGALILDVDTGIEHKLESGERFRISPFTRHRFKSHMHFCRFIEISTHHEDSDSYYH